MFAYDGGPEFRFYGGGPGSGSILFDDRGVRAIPPYEASYRGLNSGNWAKELRPISGTPGLSDFGTSHIFLIVRAYFISRAEIRHCHQMYQASDDAETAWREIQMGSLFRAWAEDARLVAMTHPGALPLDWEHSLVSDSFAFVAKCEEHMAAFASNGNFSLEQAMEAFGEKLKSLIRKVEVAQARKTMFDPAPVGPGKLPDVRDEVLLLCNLIATAASQLDRVPTKAEVRNVALASPSREVADRAQGRDEFLQRLEVAGFGWLPRGKAGRPPKSQEKR